MRLIDAYAVIAEVDSARVVVVAYHRRDDTNSITATVVDRAWEPVIAGVVVFLVQATLLGIT